MGLFDKKRNLSKLPASGPGVYCIIMADVIGSSQHSGAEMKRFFDVVERANHNREIQLLSPLTVTLGDEFQGVVRSVRDAVKAIIYIEEALLSLKSPIMLRYVVHLGEIETDINPVRAHAMVGPGLTKARQSLGEMKKGDTRFKFMLGNPQWDTMIGNAFEVWGGFIAEWKEKDKQFELAAELIHGEDYKVVAEKMHTDRGNIWRRMSNLRFKDFLLQRELITNLTGI